MKKIWNFKIHFSQKEEVKLSFVFDKPDDFRKSEEIQNANNCLTKS